jgi:VCBS repeat-containing protein
MNNKASGASPLFAATRRVFSSVASRMAIPRLDASIDGVAARNRAGETALLSIAAALLLSTTKGAVAAEADTLLDEDRISYKNLPHGVFELVTKEVIPRHIFVEDPEQTIVLSKVGSSISVIQVTNSAGRMDELQLAQQELYANLGHGPGHNGSGTTPFADTLPAQPINFTQPDGPDPLGTLPELPSVQTTPEFIFIKAAAPEPPPPFLTLNLGSGPTETDTVVFDTFAATSGTFSASSSTAAPLTYGISGGTPGSTVIDGVAYDVSEAGDFGTLYVNSTTGAYTFVPDDTAINALKTPTTESFTITVSDGAASASQAFTIDIDGVNDSAVVDGNVSGSVGEGAGVAGFARFAAAHAPRVATGTLTSTDVDDPANAFTAVSSPTQSDHGYGTFTMSADGVWAYTLDDGNSEVQALNVGDHLTDTFTVTTVDGTEQVVTIVIGGRNDAAVISGDTQGSVVEAACKDPGVPTATGTLTATDVDNPSDTFTPVKCEKSDGGYGTFTMTADGVWTYTLDNDNCKVQSLGDCDTLTDTFTVTSIDGTEQTVTIVIAGTNDSAIISGTKTGAVVEAACEDPGKPTACGTLTDKDVDNADNTFTPVKCATSDGGYGTFTMTADGKWTYKLDNDNCVVQSLDDCDTLIDTFKVTTIDGTEQVVTIAIHGADDGHKDFHHDDSFHFTDEGNKWDSSHSAHDLIL